MVSTLPTWGGGGNYGQQTYASFYCVLVKEIEKDVVFSLSGEARACWPAK